MKKIKFKSAEEWQQWFWGLPIVCSLLAWSKKTSLPGFFSVPIYDIVVFVFNEIRRFDLFTRANSIAYSFFLSLFPSLLTLFTFAPFLLHFFSGYIPELNNFNQIIQEEIQKIMPGQAGDAVFAFIHDITNQPRVGLLSFGFILAIYFSSNGMLAMMQSFEKSYHGTTFKQRGGLKKRMVAVMLTGLIGLLVILSVVFIILGGIFITWLSEAVNLSHFTTAGITILRWFAIIMIYYFGIAVLYRYGAATFKRISIFSAGTTLATVLSMLSSLAFSYYVDEFNRYDSYNKFYGSIGTMIIMMLWIQINSLILLIGFELNAAIAVNRDIKIKQQE